MNASRPVTPTGPSTVESKTPSPLNRAKALVNTYSSNEEGLTPEERARRLKLKTTVAKLGSVANASAKARSNAAALALTRYGTRLTAKRAAWIASHPGLKLNADTMKRITKESLKEAYGFNNVSRLSANVRKQLPVVSAGKSKRKTRRSTARRSAARRSVALRSRK